MDADVILSENEIATVLKDLRRKDSKTGLARLAIFRLATFGGLRTKEICGLNLGDVVLQGDRPTIYVTQENGKGDYSARKVPLWWNPEAVVDLLKWRDYRVNLPGDAFICSVSGPSTGQRMPRQRVYDKWRTIVTSILPEERAKQLTGVHRGRHTFCSYNMCIGRKSVEVQRAAGHGSVVTTEGYIHLMERDNCPLGEL